MLKKTKKLLGGAAVYLAPLTPTALSLSGVPNLRGMRGVSLNIWLHNSNNFRNSGQWIKSVSNWSSFIKTSVILLLFLGEKMMSFKSSHFEASVQKGAIW